MTRIESERLACSEMLRGCPAGPENRIRHAVRAMELKERTARPPGPSRPALPANLK
ncbi:MAG: hypothetical protein J6S40_06115 [Thermoguttaceae bacterium]|nr:hypothetical protein [Thermoguttaceae bacterium]